jgi:dephospho-CoA kinase
MSAWPGKYVIGLTGNIATGKSVVRKMLEHLGAYGIDADALGHRAIAKDAPGYKSVVDTFGRWIIAEDGQIDRARLARIVFADPDALKHLEEIIHPFVRQAVDILVRRSTQAVVVVEAIKLLESPLRQSCDSIWVTHAPPEIQLGRLIQKRKMNEDAARQRINAQDPQEQKIAAANVVIRNDGSYEDTWKQVSNAWAQLFPSSPAETLAAQVEATAPGAATAPGVLTIEKARPRQAQEIANLITRLSGGMRKLTSSDIMEAFGEKAFIFLKLDDRPVGILGWQVENLVARTDDLYLDPQAPVESGLKVLLEQVEETSRDLQCEALLLFLPPNLARQEKIWHTLGYELRTIHSLGVRAWQEAAQENLATGEVMLFKQLRKDRVLRPV